MSISAQKDVIAPVNQTSSPLETHLIPSGEKPRESPPSTELSRLRSRSEHQKLEEFELKD